MRKGRVAAFFLAAAAAVLLRMQQCRWLRGEN